MNTQTNTFEPVKSLRTKYLDRGLKVGFEGRRIFVTGTDNNQAKNLLPSLVERGAEVTAQSLSIWERNALKNVGALPLSVQLQDADKLSKAAKRSDVWVHFGLDIRCSAAENVEQFSSVLRAADEAGIAHFVLLSDARVYENYGNLRVSERASRISPSSDGFAAACSRIERMLEESKLKATILQPTMVWGSGAWMWTGRFARVLGRSNLRILNDCGLFNGVHVNDVSNAIMRAISLRPKETRRFIISGNEQVTWSDLLNGYAQAVGNGKIERVASVTEMSEFDATESETLDVANPRVISTAIQRIRALIAQGTSTLMFRPEANKDDAGINGDLSFGLKANIQASAGVSMDRARRELGYEPTIDLRDGLLECREYCRTEAFHNFG